MDSKRTKFQRKPNLVLSLTLLASLLLVTQAEAKIEYVIAISIDGGRGDYLRTFVETAPDQFPNFKRLQDFSAYTYNARTDVSYTITIPDHLCMLTGRTVAGPGAMHGITTDSPASTETVHNSGLATGMYKASIFDVVHDNGLSTALYMGKTRLQICDRSWDTANGAVDTTGADNGRDKIDVAMVSEALGTNATSTLLADFVSAIQNTTLKNFTFFHIADTDYAGHMSGWTTAEGSSYRNAMRMADGWIGQILDSVRDNPALADKVAILLTADHGGGSPSSNHTVASVAANYTIPFFLCAPGLPGGTDIHQWLENRFDPGTAQPAYTSLKQPMRNGDIANISAALLGLPPVPGSAMKAEFRKSLSISRTDEAFVVSWPLYLTGCSLEATDNLTTPDWQLVSSGFEESQGRNTHTFTALASPMRFFRLRTPMAAPASMAEMPHAEPPSKKAVHAAASSHKPAKGSTRKRAN